MTFSIDIWKLLCPCWSHECHHGFIHISKFLQLMKSRASVLTWYWTYSIKTLYIQNKYIRRTPITKRGMHNAKWSPPVRPGNHGRKSRNRMYAHYSGAGSGKTAAGEIIKQIIEEHPRPSKEKIRAALAFASATLWADVIYPIMGRKSEIPCWRVCGSTDCRSPQARWAYRVIRCWDGTRDFRSSRCEGAAAFVAISQVTGCRLQTTSHFCSGLVLSMMVLSLIRTT